LELKSKFWFESKAYFLEIFLKAIQPSAETGGKNTKAIAICPQLLF
jgi:hypothetical protein